jgi:mono/diheme cytochrome c family protein
LRLLVTADSVSPEVAAGAHVFVQFACGQCHGDRGIGGAIPSLSGPDFRKEFNTDTKITEMVRTGSVLGRAPIVSMPHWGGIISNADLKALVAYLKTLK